MDKWRTGLAGFTKLREDQREVYKFILRKRIESKDPLLQICRRWGKTFTTLSYVIDTLNQNPGWVAKWACPDKDMARTIIQPEFNKIIEDCPEELKPKYHNIDSFYEFPNKSRLYLHGVSKDKGKTLRGSFANLIVLDEFGFWSCPEIVETILKPQLLTTRGQMVFISTPPEDLGHPYYSRVSTAISENRIIERTIYDNSSLTQEDLDKAIHDSGGFDSPAFQREYLCKPVANPESLVIPEFKDDIHLSEDSHSAISNYYVSLDLGFSDQTAVLFAAHDFPNDILYILDEVILTGANSRTIVEACKAKEQTHFLRPPWRRVSDNDLQQIYDFQTLYDYSVIPTQKWDKQSAINQLRLRFSAKKIKIHPRCKSLAFQLKVGIWNPRRTEFLRGEATGHLDAIDALIYLNRNIDQSHNPIVEHFDWSSSFQSPHYVSESDKGIRELGDFFHQPSRDEP